MGNPIPLLSISNFSGRRESKPLVYVIARQHPGQTPASFIVEGLISFLVGVSLQAKELRERFQFKIVPMMNVDGVISGNYRSNLSGSDVNRQWQYPSKRGQPEVFWLKQQISSNRKQVLMFLDIHAHSRKMGSFFYGSRAVERDRKLYPFVCSRLNKFISYAQSAFSDDPSKRTTARVVLENQCLIARSLTFEASFYGWMDQNKKAVHTFKQNDLRGIGESLGIGFYYSLVGMQKVRKGEDVKLGVFPKFSSEKEKTLYKNSLKMQEKWSRQIEKEVAEQKQEEYSEGSSLDPEHFQLREEEREFVAETAKLSRQVVKDQLNKSRILSTPKKISEEQRRRMIYSSLSPAEVGNSKLLAPKSKAGHENLRISGGQFFKMSFSGQKQKKKMFTVRELQLELQNGSTSQQKRLRGMRLKMSSEHSTGMGRYQSLNLGYGERSKNYREEVLQMKKALKYLLQSKNSNYDQYRSWFKSAGNDYMSTTLGRSERRSNK